MVQCYRNKYNIVVQHSHIYCLFMEAQKKLLSNFVVISEWAAISYTASYSRELWSSEAGLLVLLLAQSGAKPWSSEVVMLLPPSAIEIMNK